MIKLLQWLGFMYTHPAIHHVDTMALAYQDADGNIVEAWHYTTQLKSMMPRWLHRIAVLANDIMLLPPIGGFDDSRDIQDNQIATITDWIVCPVKSGHVIVYPNDLFRETFSFINTTVVL